MSFATILIANGSDLPKRRIRADSTSAPQRYTTTRALRQQSGSAGCRFSAGGGGSTGREQIEKSDKAIIAVEAISEQCPQPTPRGALPNGARPAASASSAKCSGSTTPRSSRSVRGNSRRPREAAFGGAAHAVRLAGDRPLAGVEPGVRRAPEIRRKKGQDPGAHQRGGAGCWTTLEWSKARCGAIARSRNSPIFSVCAIAL